MKATAYYAKYGKAIYEERTAEEKKSDSTYQLIVELSNEVKELCDKRNVKQISGVVAVIKEIDERWNKICRLFEKEYGKSPLIRNGFREFWIRQIPELKAYL